MRCFLVVGIGAFIVAVILLIATVVSIIDGSVIPHIPESDPSPMVPKNDALFTSTSVFSYSVSPAH